MKFNLTYGTGKVSFNIKDSSLPKEMPFIKPRDIKTPGNAGDVEGTITAALEEPVNSPRLKDLVTGKRVALIVSDEFRAGQHEMILKCMLREISLGRPKEVWIFCATGSHDPKIYAGQIGEWTKTYANEFGLKHTFFGHDCIKDKHVEIGKCANGLPIRVMEKLLRCEVRTYGHESKHHYMNGYSCIDKQLLPGLSDKETIESNHKNALNDAYSFGGRGPWVKDPARKTNPFAEGCHEARKAADKTFLNENGELERRELAIFGLDMISDTKHIYWIAAGDTSKISKMMTEEADKLAAFEVLPTKYVVISPGGPPASQALYGTQNCFDMALSGAIKDGGDALVVAPCDGRPDLPEDVKGLAPDEKSKKLFYDNLVRMKDMPIEEATRWIDKNFELYLWKTDRVLKLLNRRKVNLYLYSTLSDEKVEAAGFIPVKNVQEWIDERIKRNNSKFRVIDQGNKILIMGR